MAGLVTGVVKRAEFSILGLVEIVGGVAIATADREIGGSSCRSHLRSVMGSQLPPACVTRSRTLLGARLAWPVRASSTRPWEVIGFEELLSELVARARMLRPHLGSRLVSCHSHLRSVMGSQLPPACVPRSRTLLGARLPWPVRASSTRPWEVIGFEELLSELVARARMLRPHLVSRLVSAMLTYGIRCRTLSCEERCVRMIANPVKSTCT